MISSLVLVHLFVIQAIHGQVQNHNLNNQNVPNSFYKTYQDASGRLAGQINEAVKRNLPFNGIGGMTGMPFSNLAQFGNYGNSLLDNLAVNNGPLNNINNLPYNSIMPNSNGIQNMAIGRAVPIPVGSINNGLYNGNLNYNNGVFRNLPAANFNNMPFSGMTASINNAYGIQNGMPNSLAYGRFNNFNSMPNINGIQTNSLPFRNDGFSSLSNSPFNGLTSLNNLPVSNNFNNLNVLPFGNHNMPTNANSLQNFNQPLVNRLPNINNNIPFINNLPNSQQIASFKDFSMNNNNHVPSFNSNYVNRLQNMNNFPIGTGIHNYNNLNNLPFNNGLANNFINSNEYQNLLSNPSFNMQNANNNFRQNAIDNGFQQLKRMNEESLVASNILQNNNLHLNSGMAINSPGDFLLNGNNLPDGFNMPNECQTGL